MSEVRKNSFTKRMLRPTENPAVEILESSLGIEIPDPPRKVEQTRLNRFLSDLIEIPGVIAPPLPRLADNVHAIYDATDNTIYTRTPASLIADAHETMHSYIDKKNPALDKGPEDSSAETFVSTLCFCEGMATWTETRIAEEHLTEIAVDDPSYRRFLEESDMPVNTLCATAPEEEQKALAIEAIQLYEEAIDPTNTKRRRRESRRKAAAQLSSQDTKYTLGLHFVEYGMVTLQEAGRGEGEAIDTLIENPPSTMEHLLNPKKFFEEKGFLIAEEAGGKVE